MNRGPIVRVPREYLKLVLSVLRDANRRLPVNQNFDEADEALLLAITETQMHLVSRATERQRAA